MKKKNFGKYQRKFQEVAKKTSGNIKENFRKYQRNFQKISKKIS